MIEEPHLNGASTPTPVLELPCLDPAARHGLMGEYLRIVCDSTEAHEAALLSQLCAVIGNIAGRAVFRIADGTRHHLNFFIAVVGSTSAARKGTALSHVLSFAWLVDSDWARACVRSGLVSGEGLVWAVRDVGELKGKVVDGVLDKRLLGSEAELAAVLNVCQRPQNNLSPTLRDFWDGKRVVSTMAKNSPAVATDAHISVVGHITPEELRRTLTTTEVANGFGNRFMWFLVERTKILPFGGEGIDQRALESLAMKFRQALEASRRIGHELGMSQAAREIWISIYESLTRSKPGLLGQILARAAAQVLRLSCLYAMLDSSSEINEKHLLAAIAVWKYVESSARQLFGDLTGDTDADAILSALRSQPAGLTRTDISNLFARNVGNSRIERSLTALLGFGLVRFEEERTTGRPAMRWFAITKG
jgi:hypothetical protein